MPEEGATENVDPNRSKFTSASEVIERGNTKIKGVSWQDGVDGKSLFTVRSHAIPSFAQSFDPSVAP